ncbi:hypothetical protein EHO61_05305 [Leptospira fluminis]|uniref:Uncharacterized protein n=1 Tax=Leptospira fluminis TaxID=2484979 RepID=A0A4R9GRH1_9LEPT|nr:hypothetical protein EHO61_05305 [Leptospira fluminis]
MNEVSPEKLLKSEKEMRRKKISEVSEDYLVKSLGRSPVWISDDNSIAKNKGNLCEFTIIIYDEVGIYSPDFFFFIGFPYLEREVLDLRGNLVGKNNECTVKASSRNGTSMNMSISTDRQLVIQLL